MKVQGDIWPKLKACFCWLFDIEYKHTIYEVCEICGGHNFEILYSCKKGQEYKEKYKCMGCGAFAYVTEVWETQSEGGSHGSTRADA